MIIQRYDCMMVGMAEGYGRMAQVDSGGYVLYTDHLAALAEKERRADEIAEKTIKAFERYEEQIAALQAENTRLASEWQQTHNWNNELVKEHYELKARIKELEEGNKIIRQQLLDELAKNALTPTGVGRLKIMTEALEKIKMMAKDATGERNMSPERVIRIVEAALGGRNDISEPPSD